MQYETINKDGFGIVVHREISNGTIITKYAGGVTRKDYPNGTTKFFQGQPVNTFSGAVTGNLGGIQADTSQGSSLGR